MDQQRAQIRVTALANAQQTLLAAGGGLPRHQAQPRRQLPAILERLRIARARGQRTNPWYVLQPLARRTLAVPRTDSLLQLLHLPIELAKMLPQATEELAAQARQAILGILQYGRGASGVEPFGR
jgi:hypothetical protein